MTTALYTHSDCLNHVTPPGHPEQVARLRFVNDALAGTEFDPLDRHEAPLCADADILLCHPQSYLDAIASAIPVEGSRALDADTHVAPGSLTAARRGVGGVLAAVDAVLSGEASNAFVACRPPGHHALADTPMGFCLFGNIAIAAKHALDRHGLNRVAVVDFDVHHGNGTQALLWDEARAMLFTSQQMPHWPGSGDPSERGAHDNIVNIPLAPGTGSAEMRRSYEAQVFPALSEFAPELILISAGFDAHRADPLSDLNWSTDDYVWLTQRLCGVADTVAEGRVVSTLEGGYDLNALAAATSAHVKVLMERGT